MKKVIGKVDGGYVHMKLWLDDLEAGAMEQTINLSKLPFAFKHIALMPDAHQGYGMPIGGVLATSAKNLEIGIIPGSQGTCSYIVQGLGNEDSFKSCSHGAGRKMSRNEARRTLNLQGEIDSLNAKGIIHAIRNVDDLDEVPSSYKDIDVVMDNQKDLVNILVKLTPIGVIKG